MDLEKFIEEQKKFSKIAFGPYPRPKGIIEHIKSELEEIEKDPEDLLEWVDVILLAIDGAWRAGYSGSTIEAALKHKLEVNKNREWPDWRDADEGEAIEHVK